jgi:pimeloyl-ACP methyl ester carboxylesterase
MLKRTFLPAVIAMLAITACAPPVAVKRLSPEAAQREQTANVLTSGRLSDFTTIELRRYDLLERFDDEPADAIQALHARVQAGTARSEELFALAELSYLHAQSGGGRPHYLASALYAYALIFREVDEGDTLSDLDPRNRWAAEIYNRALAEAFATDGTEALSLQTGTYALPFGQISIAVDKGNIHKPGRWEIVDLAPAADVVIHGLRNRYRRVGIGTPLAGRVKISDENMLGAKYAAKTAHVPVTMVLRVEQPRAQLRGAELQGKLDLFPFSDIATVDIGGVAVPLESEPSVALAKTLAASRFWEREMAVFLGHALGQKTSSRFTVLEPYQPGRIPVFLVHGTGSSSARWADMVNDLLADPRIHGNFHFWMFQYDSGNPIVYSSYKLRSGLEEIHKVLNPDGTNECAEQSVVIGHSQGGLLTKMTVIDSGDKFWRNSSSKPFDEVKLSPEQRQLAQDALFVEPLPFVSRVIFIATPQRGSYLAGPQFVRRLLQRLITLPADVLSVGAALATAAVGADPTSAQALSLQTLPTAIDNMSPNHPFIRAISEIPIAPGVKVHSIIPVKGKGPYEDGNDGVVRYKSAHIEPVDSELVVRSSHSTQANPHTVEEVRRILLEHLAASGCDSTGTGNQATRPVPLSRIPVGGKGVPAEAK